MSGRGRFVLPILTLVAASSCGHSVDPGAAIPTSQVVVPAAPGEPSIAATRRVVLDLAGSPEACAFGHRGVLLDFGEPAMAASLRPGSLRVAPDELVEREGATWLRVRSRTLVASFYWPAAAADGPDGNVYAEARIRAGVARAVSVAIDGKPIGVWMLPKGETSVVMARASGAVSVSPGGHELTLRFAGGARAGDEALAELDWVHVGAGEATESYAAPTHRDVVVDATLGGRALRALSLRAPGFVRCSGWIPANATLEVGLATAGSGDADVEARLVRDRRPPTILGQATVAGSASDWVPWSVPVTGLESDGALASIEIVVKRAAKGTRVLLGAARVVAADPTVAAVAPQAGGVVLVVLGSTAPRSLAPWGGPHAAAELVKLAATGTTFLAHRASSTQANAVVASMITGLSPSAHRVEDADARLPEGLTTVQEACRQGRVSTAMFTANPTTGAAFGFARGWDTFTAHDPLESGSATRVFDDAAEWVEAHRAERFFVLVHARGGHPPWDATPDELKTMPPDGYFGMIEPHRAAEALAKARKHPGRFKEDDRIRAWALYDYAVDAQDAALGRLMAALRNTAREADTTVIVTSDVAANEAPPVPFCDPEALDEPLLGSALVVRWPGAPSLAGRRVDAATSAVDIARTVLDTLGLAAPSAFEGVDLAAVAQGTVIPAQRPLLATRAARLSARWGPYVLLGARDRELRMCDLSLDPSCVADVRGTAPLALEPLRRWVLQALAPRQPPPPPRAPAILDAHALSALVRWGRSSENGKEGDF
ncbi:MAG TPA: sulfatase-like hydrolase/transferase [Polyangiaceae bacterium]|nr:sulfatase-like hydrolase/transferase [Polyangiaceae bacterium]